MEAIPSVPDLGLAGKTLTVPRGLVIAGPQSGVGKTTIALGLLAAYRRRGFKVQSFKVGPDFIDPGHHTRAAGRVCRNLDGWMLTKGANMESFQCQAQGADLVVVEGVMGLFDGHDGIEEAGSTAQMAKWLGLPVVLVVDARSMARSAAALVHGFATFDSALRLIGVIFNRVGSPTHLDYLREAVEQAGEVRYFGGLPREEDLAIPERHLGLVTSEDYPLGGDYLRRLADLVERHLDLDGLLDALPPITAKGEPAAAAHAPAVVRLGVARDRAFCFYYPENLEWLARFGAEIVPVSPLDHRDLPEVHGLYLGGGYPELFARELSANRSMRRAIREQAAAGLPIYAECGGLMYLSREICDLEGRRHAMAGVLPFAVRMLPRFKTLGYREVTLTVDCLLGPAGTYARGHEFHYSEIIVEPADLPRVYQVAGRRGAPPHREGYAVNRVLASYIHLHFGSNPEIAGHMVACCRMFKENR